MLGIRHTPRGMEVHRLHNVKRRRYFLITPRKMAYAAEKGSSDTKERKRKEKGDDATSIRHAKKGSNDTKIRKG